MNSYCVLLRKNVIMMKITKVTDNNWCGYYEQVKAAYEAAFPDITERADFDSLVDLYSTCDDVHSFGIYIAIGKEGAEAVIVYDYFPKQELTVIEYVFAVIPHEKYAWNLVRFLWNMESWKTVMVELDWHSDKHVFRFWDALGLRAIQMKYVQPPLSDMREPCYTLGLCIRSECGDRIEMEYLYSLLRLYFSYAFKLGMDGADHYININRALNVMHN